jgi:hypothetical protein
MPKRILSVAFLAFFAFVVGWFGWVSFGATSVAFESSEGDWSDQEVPLKGRDFTTIAASFERYKTRCGRLSAKLFRTTKPNLYNVFEWWNYAFDPKWNVPYRAPQILSSTVPRCAND